jgi:hypothetical protein
MTATTQKIRSALFREEEPEWLVWALVIVLLAVGLFARTIVLNRWSDFGQDNLSVSYPASWTRLASQAEHEVLGVREPFDAGMFPARFTLLQMPVTDISTSAQTPGDFALKWADRNAKDLLGYKVLSIEEVKVRGKDAVRVDYVYVTEAEMATPNSVPIVAEGADVLIRRDDVMTVASFSAAADAFGDLEGVWNRILGSLELK